MFWFAPEMRPLNTGNPVVGYSVLYRSFQDWLAKQGINLGGGGQGPNYLHFMPPHHLCKLVRKYPGGNKLLVTMWETDSVSPEWCKTINEHFKALVVPNKYNKNLFIEGGVKIPIYVVSLGINPSYFVKLERKRGDVFYFLHYNAGEHRKGWYLLTEAFRKEFKNEPNVKLIVKNSGNRSRSMHRTLRFNKDLQDKVEVLQGRYTIKEMLEIAQKSHCFVFPAIGEGYGYTPREMLATGLPTIISSGHSFDELSDDYIKLPTEKKGGIGFMPEVEKSYSFSLHIDDPYKGQNFWYVDVDVLRQKMREVYENWEDYRAKAEEASPRVWKEEDMDLCYKPLVEVLQKHYLDTQ